MVPLKVGIFSIAKSLKHCEQMAVVNCDVVMLMYTTKDKLAERT